ncbi:MAG TPA: bifunctional DNA-formamidopyrimidine glycosylase/DNA-(apurinic or apyrimidinic site) lyase [Bryobacteraceae bacterium]|jgi:formamidopyrimidine-DNA glycosylase|nr:bifunctional DNA-formamidopyrimidine glycosylase/DNA-(apurinic or apyrimidinic site) lyase [Bryobacteraceae bacterium]
MPELPEVETVTRSIAPLVGRRILSAEFRCLRILRGGDPDHMSATLAGKKIAGVKRYGKFIVVSLAGGGYLTIHLGMTGRLLLGGPTGKHTHAIFTLDRRGVLLYDDSRQFGCIEYSDEFPKRVARLGPEPLEVEIDKFIQGMKGRRTSIKALLLNQTFLRGIGNIYADESLFRAGIHPQTIAARLRPERARKLHAAIREVLAEAIEAGGSSISDYVDAEGRKGFFQLQHRVYQRTGESCVNCGAAIKRAVIAQRSSHFCPRCQKR